jgi:ATP-dependent DNA helicase Rep
MKVLTDDLNLAQQEAVNHMHGPCLVLAGAGSGKTRVITRKIGRLIQTGMAPPRCHRHRP